jgi:AraC-like DNA-binding protein
VKKRDADTDRAILVRPGVGITAGIIQRSDLRFSRIAIDQPTLIVVRRGEKVLHAGRGEWTVRAGEAIAIAGGETFHVANRVSPEGFYDARWLVWDPALIEAFTAGAKPLAAPISAVMLGPIDSAFLETFDRALEAIGDVQSIPHDVARHRLTEVLVWLSTRGIRFDPVVGASLALRIRGLIASALDESWTAAVVASRLGMSEATLRRHLAAESTTFGDLLVDARMSFAMKLLQSTDHSINRIALEIGYESASRFAIRFRQRFGFPPSAIRGHRRPLRSAVATTLQSRPRRLG